MEGGKEVGTYIMLLVDSRMGFLLRAWFWLEQDVLHPAMVSLRTACLALWTCSCLAIPLALPRDSSTPTATIKNGTVEGIHSSQYNQDFFLGIPYAQPPTGALRFRVPQSINASWSNPLQATQYPAACVGYGSDDWPYSALSEDCLYLNVIRPSGYGNESLPVAFWIHGGGLQEGSSIDQRYNMSFMVQRSVEIGKPVMGVSVNYRLSMWGFITGDEVVQSGNANLGFRDQRLAMHWVQENIAAFGGMPHTPTPLPFNTSMRLRDIAPWH